MSSSTQMTTATRPPWSGSKTRPTPFRTSCGAHIARLETDGYALRRPIADILRDKIYELRVRHQRVNYRLLYTFVGQNVALLAHGCTKEAEVGDEDIDRAVARRKKYLGNPGKHTYVEDDDD